ncbi:outer membrane protein assembly factor BamD [Solitalea canadensis]|uniref:Outer membrane assembly lipoprotein YfiO n=1 Tax=Solitalea canadensis (strain ATCC 29591 / DSM 3403 / JCM 21819 / LMG 8368 / NBRC 15130 / NCIMB 12057 / USAM 9D) TaxID=929556 RepID=H8KSQ3_SOLCM|nr:outer membrane protein assembly factor BamD [Solitalea canadensis]AFD05197.1 outer membrane assembly lipoprotein YfiO [Solitalea canadensis DSM 3403]
MFKTESIKRLYILGAVSLVLLGGCKSNFEKLKESGDNLQKYEKAVEYFNKGRDLIKNKKGGSFTYFQRAHDLYESLLIPYRGTAKAEDVAYGMAYSTYYLGADLLEARFQFKTLADEFPGGKYAEEARFMAAKCLYEESPTAYSLDQSNTYKALEAIQLFVELYPESKKISECNKMIDALRNKLETKSFQNAKLYLTIGDYKSAVISLRNSLRDFPDTPYREEIEFLVIKSNYLYAKNSFESKQEERYNITVDSYNSFVETFPESRFMKEAKQYNNASLKQLETITKRQQAEENKQVNNQ